MTGDIAVRKMTPGDVDDCIAVAAETALSHWSAEGFATELARPDAVALVAEEKGCIVGFIIGRFITAETSAEVYNIGVKRGVQNRGIGRKLLHAFEFEAGKHSINSIWLEVRVSNSVARTFYEHNGFCQVSVRKRFYSDPPEDALLMQKKI